MSIPRKEYPRPQFERSDWVNLNGEWSCKIDFSKSGTFREWQKSTGFEQKITVPFCPESKMSGVGYTDFIEAIWYHRQLDIPAAWQNKRIFLNFGGVDYRCIVYINGKEVGRHTGGCSPFAVELTGEAIPGNSYDLVVEVYDDLRDGLQPIGKQSPWLDSRNCSYTRTTGIYQTVWMEAVNECGLKRCRIMPDFDNGAFTFVPEYYSLRSGMELTVTLYDNGKVAAEKRVKAGAGSAVTVELAEPKAWNPATPFLYDVAYTLRDRDGKVIDQVKSYAGLRKIHLENGRFHLNNEPVFLRLVLDQGYYENSILTAPDDEALLQDIRLSMQAGFNGARLHQKIFDERFHYHADRLGYLTWAEFPDWGISFWQHFRKCNPDYQRVFRDYFAEWSAVVERDLNHPSIIAWTPFNETTRFFDLDEHRRIISDIYDLTRKLDPSRPVNDTSGYCHSKTDLWTVHIYRQTAEELQEYLDQQPVYMNMRDYEENIYKGQPFLVDEYGGVSYLPEGRKPWAKNTWGYNKEPLNQEQAENRITDLTKVLVDFPIMAGYCYTQLTDVEQEQNGIYNFDRTEKFDMQKIRKCFTMKPKWSKY